MPHVSQICQVWQYCQSCKFKKNAFVSWKNMHITGYFWTLLKLCFPGNKVFEIKKLVIYIIYVYMYFGFILFQMETSQTIQGNRIQGQGRVNLDTKNPVFQEVQKFARNLSGFATHSSAWKIFVRVSVWKT